MWMNNEVFAAIPHTEISAFSFIKRLGNPLEIRAWNTFGCSLMIDPQKKRNIVGIQIRLIILLNGYVPYNIDSESYLRWIVPEAQVWIWYLQYAHKSKTKQ
eukprot:971168_1